jgi:hypothetical protein
MDLRSDGIDAHPVELAKITDEEWRAKLPAATGLVVVYDGRTWIREPAYGALDAIYSDRRPVVFVRSRTSRFAPDFQKFFVVPLFDTTSFSHYQPQGLSGYKLVVEAFGKPRPARDSRRRGFAFLSYAGRDKQAICDRLVPALEANNIGLFDYRFTARLNEAKLDANIERHIRRAALLILYATKSWTGSPHTLLERDLARKLQRPIVAVTPTLRLPHLGFLVTRCRFGNDPSDDAAALREAIEEALATRGQSQQ